MAVAKLGSWVLGTDTLGTRVISPFVQQPGARVFTGGVERTTGTVSVVREIAATTPASLGTPGGVMAGTVTAALTEPEDVHTRKRSPWDRVDAWPPTDGDLIDVDGTLDGETWDRRFTGVLEGAAGAAQDIEVSVDGVDAIDRLNRPIVFEPLASPMPIQPSQAGTPALVVNPHLRHEHYIETALRAAGWWLGPRPASASPLHLPLVGSTIPANRNTGLKGIVEDGAGSWERAPWGIGFHATDSLKWEVSQYSTRENSELVFLAARRPSDAATQTIRMRLKGLNDTRFILDVFFTATTVQVRSTPATGLDWTGPLPDADAAVHFRLTYNGKETQLYVDHVLRQTGTETRENTANSTTELTVSPQDHSPLIGHIIVGRAGEVYDPTPPNAHLLAGDLYKSEMRAGRYLDTTIVNVLRDIAQATNAAAWIDKRGHFIWAHPDALGAQESVATLTADADVLDMAWRHQHSDLRHRVRVPSQEPVITVSDRADVEWWTGAGDIIDADQEEKWWERLTVTEIASASGSEDWFPAKLGPYILKQTATSKNEFAKGEADWYGATAYYGNISDPVSGQEGVVQAETRKITSQTYEMKTVIFLSPGEQESVSPRVPNNQFTQTLHPEMVPYNGTPLPVLRGFGKVEWTAGPSTSGDAIGPVTAADYSHDPGWWVQGGDNKRLANWIASQVTVSRPLIEDLPVVPRHDLELGNVITIEEHAVYGVTIKALIIGIREQYSHGEAAMTLTLRVLEATGGN